MTTRSATTRSAELVAVVTGAASGIGLATTRALAGHGVRVVMADVDGDRLRHASEIVSDDGTGDLVVTAVADVTTREGASASVEAALRTFGRLDLLHLNAGVPGPGPLTEHTDLDAVADALRTNVMAAVGPLIAALPAMDRSDRAAVTVTSSLAGVIGSPADPVYAASKHALVGLVRSLAPALPGVRINAICPSLVRTPMISDELPDELPVLDPDDVAEAVTTQLLGDGRGEVLVLEAGASPIAVPEPRVSALQVRTGP